MTSHAPQDPNAGLRAEVEHDPVRRALLEKLGRIGGGAATPVLLSLLLSDRASAASCGVAGKPPCDPGGGFTPPP